jgi:hypothetical protein
VRNVRTVALVVGLVLTTAACTTIENTDSEAPAASESTSAPSVPRSAPLVIDNSKGRVVIIEDDGTMLETIEPPSGARYSQPIWASRDSIVYAQVAAGDNRLEATRPGEGTIWSVNLDTPPFYFLAAPGSDDTTVVSLRNSSGRPGLVIEQISGQGETQTIAEEAPFYASWHPVDGRLASHVGDMRLDITDTSTETIDASSSGFQAPLWLLSGLVALRSQGADTLLTRWDDLSFTDIAIVRGAARFIGSGNSVAIVTGGDIQTGGVQASAQALPTISSGVLTVIDLESKTFTSVTSDPTPLFQWDPTGERLLYATFIDDPTPALVWHVWENGEVTDFEPFVPEPSWFGTIAPFFDQYAQSVSLWSPDGTAFAYPALVDRAPQIMVQRIDAPSRVASSIASGTWVSWSP